MSGQDARWSAQQVEWEHLMKVSSSTLDQQILYANVMNDVYPDEQGRFGPFGGRYIPETLVPALNRLEAGVKRYLHDPDCSDLCAYLVKAVGL